MAGGAFCVVVCWCMWRRAKRPWNSQVKILQQSSGALASFSCLWSTCEPRSSKHFRKPH